MKDYEKVKTLLKPTLVILFILILTLLLIIETNKTGRVPMTWTLPILKITKSKTLLSKF
jgi:hypothetical protein